MRKFLALLRKELGAVFMAPLGYVTIAVFVAITNWLFLTAIHAQAGRFVQLEALFCISVLVCLPILVTVICMRLFAEEKRSGTIETLLTTSVGDWTVVLSKYFGAMIFVTIGLVSTLAGLPFLVAEAPGIASLDAAALLGGGIMLLLVAMCCTSIGVLVSLFARNQIVAAICCFGAICVPLMIKPVLQTVPFVRQAVLDRFSAEMHVLQYTGGILVLPPAVFYLTVTMLMLFVAVRVLESRRWI
jgi:ABC-2 type transport system permease protein